MYLLTALDKERMLFEWKLGNGISVNVFTCVLKGGRDWSKVGVIGSFLLYNSLADSVSDGDGADRELAMPQMLNAAG